MTGKCYYLATLGGWRRHAAKFAHSHYVTLDAGAGTPRGAEIPGDDARILALVEADEGAHNALEDDAEFEALPHPLAQTAISERARAALAAHGVTVSASTFDVAETMGRVHPLLRFRVF